MDRSSGAPSTSTHAKSAPILARERIIRSGAAGELRNPPIFSANGSSASSSQAWVVGGGIDDDESYIRKHIPAGNAIIMEGMVNVCDVQRDNDDGHDDAISLRSLVPYVGMTFDTIDDAIACYNKPALSHEFGIRTSASKNNQAREPQKLIGRTFTCVHA
ncbi:hypothetical protein ZWY2020_048878 [Hordeum vulgare]|nr:hypothetical protein ZWY2020_048878 [Hordeum vulgare]